MRSRLRRNVASLIAAALLISVLSADVEHATAKVAGLRLAADKPIAVKRWQPASVATSQKLPQATPVQSRWPAGQHYQLTIRGQVDPASSSALVPAAQSDRGWASLGSSGIAIADSSTTTPGQDQETAMSATPAAHRLTVDVLGGDGRSAPTLRISQADGRHGIEPLAIDLPASVLAGLYGADYASRLRWVQLANPGQLSRPTAQQLATGGQQLPRSNVQVLRTASTSASSIFLTALSAPSSADGKGDFTATPLRPASSWQVSAQTGAFAWSYPMVAPPAAAGPAPQLALSYDSQSVDGETGSTNNQPSMIGDGWSLAGAGSIDRSYVPCDQANTPINTADLCWLDDNATVSFAGHSGRLIKDSSGNWQLESDDNTKIEYLTGASNGTADGGYWRLTTTDGTQYYFGRGVLPGGATTGSAWTVPVCGSASTACSGSGASIGPFADQGWQWNLDYVVDVHHNAEAFYYSPETGSYQKYSDSIGHPSTLTSYTRGGQLSRIEYGSRATATSLGAPSGKVLLETGDRCESGASGEAGTDCATQPATTGSSGTAKYWPDVPWDQYCTTTPCSAQSPTFWTTKRLADVRTQVLTAGSYQDVDRWNLTHTFPTPGDGGDAALWLAGVSHVGEVGTDLTLPSVTFGGLGMQNRVWPVDGYASLDRFRVNAIHTESGATVSVTYSAPGYAPDPNSALQCTTGSGGTPADPSDDHLLCYQQWWTPPTAPNVPPPPSQEDWFNTYVVSQVATDPGAGQDADVMTYLYSDPAWRFDTSRLVPASKRTWSDFAGFKTVEIRHGDATEQTLHPLQSTTYTFLQGLDGDPDGPLTAPSSQLRSASVTPSSGAAVTDYRWLSGRTLETVVRNGVGGATVSDTISRPWSSAAKASSTFSYSHTENDGTGAHTYAGSFTTTARQVGDDTTTTSTPLAAGGTRTSTVTSTHESTYGRVIKLESQTPDAGTSCTSTSYADDVTDNLLGLPKEITVVGVPCASTPSYPADAISDTRTSYDGQAYGLAPTTGDATEVDTAKTYDGSGPTAWVSVTSEYDALGRTTKTTDPLGRSTGYGYDPPAAGPLLTETTTNPKGWTTVTSLDPSWGNPISVQDVNGRITTAHYDALGRTTAVWLPGNPVSNPNPSGQYSYSYPTGAAISALSMTVASAGSNVSGSATTMTPFDNTKLVSVGTRTLKAAGLTPWSYVLYDGLLRHRQSQAASPTGTGAVLSDTFYNAQGEVSNSYAPYWANHALDGSLLQPVSAAQIPSQTFTSYDGAGRSLLQQLYTADPAPGATDPKVTGAQTSWAYPGGDRTDVTPPTGAAITSTFTDSRGRTTELRQFHGALNATTRDQRSAYDRTQYGYDLQGQLTSMSDDAANRWTWQFDLLGRQTQAADPDKGTTTSTYDDAGQLLTSTDGRTSFTDFDGTVTPTASGVTLAYSYDALGRKTGEFLGSVSGRQLAGWQYDTLSDGTTTELGQLTSSTRYADGVAYTSEVTGFDNAGRPTGTAVTIPQDPTASPELQQLAGTYSTSTSYNVDGSVNTMIEPDAGGLEEDTLAYNYDGLGNLTSFHGGTAYALSVKWTGIGQLAQIQKAATTTSTVAYGYDPATGRTTGITEAIESTVDPAHGIATGTQVASRVYGYDPAGDVASESDTVAGDSQCFSYDYAQRITQAWTPSGGDCQAAASSGSLGGPAPYWQSYSYDTVGDRTGVVRHAITAGGTDSSDSYQYASPAVGGTPLPNTVSSVVHSGSASGTDSYGYDASGYTVSRPGGQALRYDVEGRQSRLSSTGGVQSDLYDADGNRLVQVETSGANAGATLYLGDTELHVGLGQQQTIGTRTYSVLGQSMAVRVATPGGSFPTSLYWTGLDAQETADEVIRTNSTSVAGVTRRYFDPFGGARGGSSSGWPDERGFLNGPADALAGTMHLGAREYDPSLGRFLSVDPVLDTKDPQSLNGYSYASSNPVTSSDPSGLHTDDPTLYGKNGNKYIYDDGKGGNGSSSYVPPPGNNGSSSAGPGPAKPNPTYNASACARFGGPRCNPTEPADTRGPNPAQFWCGFIGASNGICGGHGGTSDYREGQLFGFLLLLPLAALAEGGPGSDVPPEDPPGQGTGTAKAPDTASNAGDHIVLGLKNQGLEQTAMKVGGRTLLKDPDWQNTLRAAVADQSSQFTVSLDGMSGGSTYSQVMSSAQRGASGAGGYTDWEVAQLYEGGRLPGVTFVRGGSVVDNPFG